MTLADVLVALHRPLFVEGEHGGLRVVDLGFDCEALAAVSRQVG